MSDTIDEFYQMTTDELEEEKAYQERRQKRAEAARLRKEQQLKQERILKFSLTGAGIVLASAVLISGISRVFHNGSMDAGSRNAASILSTEAAADTADAAGSLSDDPQAVPNPDSSTEADISTNDAASVGNKASSPAEPAIPSQERYKSMLTAGTKYPGEAVTSDYAIMLDADTGEILAQREGMTRMNPASMTKILTILVAAEQHPNLDDTVTITREITDYSYSNDCSAVGFSVDEAVTVRDLFYGTILPSGGDAAATLAIYTAGSLDAFVTMMNEKLEVLGLSDTAHMTNCVGLYDKDHYCTVYDMALILKAATENEICREALTAHTYTTSSTPEHPDGITISNWFLRRIEDKDSNGTVLYAKTGYVNQSGNCAASYQLGSDQKNYICVTGSAHSAWRCIYDHVELYQMCVGK